MNLFEIFSVNNIKVGMEADDKDEAFEELVDFACRRNRNLNVTDILTVIREREAKMSTGIKKGVALPHGKTNAVPGVTGLLGISKKGIDYEALDGEPVYLLFMMLAPPGDSERHLRLLKRLAELLDNPQFCTDLIAQKDAQSANDIIKKYEEVFLILE